MSVKSVLAIDPGSERSALVWWDGAKIKAASIVANEHLAAALTDTWPDTHLAVEKIVSLGMPTPNTVHETNWWAGRFFQAWKQASSIRTAERVTRMTIKLHLCGDSRAQDSNIRQALIDRFGPPGTKKKPGVTYGLKYDLWQAFALAVTVHDNLNGIAP